MRATAADGTTGPASLMTSREMRPASAPPATLIPNTPPMDVPTHATGASLGTTASTNRHANSTVGPRAYSPLVSSHCDSPLPGESGAITRWVSRRAVARGPKSAPVRPRPCHAITAGAPSCPHSRTHTSFPPTSRRRVRSGDAMRTADRKVASMAGRPTPFLHTSVAISRCMALFTHAHTQNTAKGWTEHSTESATGNVCSNSTRRGGSFTHHDAMMPCAPQPPSHHHASGPGPDSGP